MNTIKNDPFANTGIVTSYKPITNYDSIMAEMTPEKMASDRVEMYYDAENDVWGTTIGRTFKRRKDAILAEVEWLKQPKAGE